MSSTFFLIVAGICAGALQLTVNKTTVHWVLTGVIVLLMLCGAIVLILRASKRNADAQAHHAPLGGQSFESARSFRNGSVQGSSDGNIYGAPSLGASTQSEYDVGDIK